MNGKYQHFTRADFERIVAEPPINNMGKDFAHHFGEMAYKFFPNKKNFRILTQKAFEKRLSLAKKYNTAFLIHMTGDKKNKIPPWKERINGLTNRRSFSFGIRHHPRAHGIWKFFNSLSEKKAEKIKINPRAFRELQIGLPKIKNPILRWSFPCKESSSFKVYKLDKNAYVLSHAKNVEVPKILKCLNSLWKKVLDGKISKEKRVQALAEFEWLWFFTNPYGRGGAAIGNLLSIILQKKIASDGVEIRTQNKFINQDLEAFTKQEKEYISIRKKQLLD